jgi:hypothetical protein
MEGGGEGLTQFSKNKKGFFLKSSIFVLWIFIEIFSCQISMYSIFSLLSNNIYILSSTCNVLYSELFNCLCLSDVD